MDGDPAFTPTPASGRGVPPEADVRHKLERPPRHESKTMSRPSGVQVAPNIGRLSKVSRLGSPPVVGTRNRSATIAPFPARMKATVEPGENTGRKSNWRCGGDVRCLVVES